MASLSNINGIFDVHSTGAILFSTSHGTSGQILRSNGNAAPTWVNASTVIGGPYLPLSGGTLTGNLAINGTNTLSVGGNITANDGLFIYGTSYWVVSSSDAALQRVDARDDATNFSRLHWYGESDSGTTSNFRHAYYDGASYIDVTASAGIITYTGGATFTGLVSGITPTAAANFATKAYVDGIGAGVSKIIASTNITISPVSGLGDVTISATDTTYTSGNGITFTGTPATVINADINYISYSGSNNFIVYGTQNSEGTTIPTGSQIAYADSSGTQIVSRGLVSDLPFTNNIGGPFLPLGGGTMTGTITMGTQNFAVAANYGRGVFGLYDATKYQHVWSMGTAYKLADNGLSTGLGGNLYGLAWSYNPDYGAVGNNAQSKAGLNHQLLLMQNGTTTFAAGTGMWTSGTVTAPTFVGALTGNATSASTLTHNENRTDSTSYPVVWMTGSPTPAYSCAAVTITSSAGRINATTFNGALTGNASTSTTFSTGRTNYKGVTDAAVIGQMMWKNYGNYHTIFDASSSTSPQGGSINNTNSTNAWTPTYPTLMGWNGTSTYGVRVDSARIADSATVAGNYLPLAGGIMSGNIGRSAHNVGFLVGGYNNIGPSEANTSPIYALGTSYLPTATALSNMYGIGYARGDASFLSVAAGLGWGMYVAADGDARIFLDAGNGDIYATNKICVNSYANQAGSLLFSAGQTTGTTRSLNLRTISPTNDPSSVDQSDATGITWGQRTDSNPYYIIYPKKENWSSSGNYSKLTLAWHTGIRIGANDAYGGTRFYDDSPDISGAAVILNVGVGNTNVGVVNDLTVGVNAGIGTTVTTGGFNVNNANVGSYYNMSNHDSGNFKYTNQAGRLLTSNGAGWVADGRDPILTLASAGNGGATTVGYSVGLNLYSNTATDNTYSPLICFSNLSNSGNYATAYAAIGGKKVGAGTDSNWSTGELHFWTAGPTGSGSASYMQQASAMMIDDAGAVGIATNTPSAKLHVNGNIRWGGSSVAPYVYSDIDAGGLYIENVGSTAANSAIRLQCRNTNAGSYSSIKIDPSSSTITANVAGTNRMILDTTSYIYHNTGSTTFNANGYIYTQSWINLGGGAGIFSSTNGAHFYPNAVGTYGTWRISGSRNGYSGIYDNHSTTNFGMYDSSGNGGAWSASAGWHYYYVPGDACLAIGSSTTSSTYSLYVTGAIYSTADIVAYSDRRSKENIVTIDNALDKVSKIRGVYYTPKEGDDKSRKVGVIAQELNEILPEAVTYAEDVDKYGVDYGKITGLLIEAVKELQAKVKELENK